MFFCLCNSFFVFLSCEAAINLLTMLVLDCSFALATLSNTDSSPSINFWIYHFGVCNPILAFKDIKFIVKQYFNISLQAWQDFAIQVNKFGFLVCWINKSIWVATIWLFKSIIFSFSQDMNQIVKSRIGVIGWKVDLFEDGIGFREIEKRTGEPTILLLWVSEELYHVKLVTDHYLYLLRNH